MENNNISSNESDETLEDLQKEEIREDAKGLFRSLKTFLVSLLDFRKDTDRDETITAIKADIPFKGATAWILIFSVFVASVGLNADNTAVVIGAMLISPLMGPILGIGLSIAINDIDTLKKSLINFGVMIILSVLTAFLFFWLFPLREESSELLSRTQPDIRDVLIAFFGGLALIIARTKKGTIASVIFGVAIATALMPPLCTVGYGLAEALIHNSKGLQFAGGAMYLFIINTIFIALATFLVVKVLRFPMIKYANSKRRKMISRVASFLAILVMIPASLTFYKVYSKNQFSNDAKRFISTELEALPNANYIKRNATYEYIHKGVSIIELTTFGQDQISETALNILKNRLNEYSALNETKLLPIQAILKDDYVDEIKYMEELRSRDSLDLLTQSQKIIFLEDQVLKLSKLERDQIPFKSISEEAHINYENLESIQYSKTLLSNFNKIDTLSVFMVKWNDSIEVSVKEKDIKKLSTWLQYKLKLDTMVVREMN